MPRFACPLCKSILSVDADQAGSAMACTSCGKKIRVPAGKPGSSSAARPAPPPLKTSDDAEETAIEDAQATRKASAVVRKKARDEEEDDDVPPPSRPPRLRKAPRDEDPDAEPRRRPPANDDEPEPEDDVRPRRKRKKKKQESSAVAAISGTIGSIGGLLMLALFILIVSGKGPRWLMDFIEEKLRQNGIPPLLAIGIAAAVFLVPVGLWILVSLKGTILNAMPDELDFAPTRPSKFRNLDTDQLDQYTEELEALGFTQVMDYTVRTELEHFPSGFARLFVNEEESCYAEVNQGFHPDGEPVPMRCMIASHMDEDWSLMTSDRTPSKEAYLMRRPRAAWRSLPDKDPDDLLTHHRKMRKKMLKALEVGLVEKLSSKAYFAREVEANRERKEVVRARWTIAILIEFFFFDRNPKYEWLGEYSSLAD